MKSMSSRNLIVAILYDYSTSTNKVIGAHLDLFDHKQSQYNEIIIVEHIKRSVLQARHT